MSWGESKDSPFFCLNESYGDLSFLKQVRNARMANAHPHGFPPVTFRMRKLMGFL